LTRGYDDTWTQSFPNNAFDAENQALAARLHGALFHAAGEQDRGLRHARFLGVLRGQKRPAVLLEGGYLSNPAEAQRIEDPGFRQKLAEALAAALNLNAAAQSPRPESGGSAIEISRPTPP
jgi:N-acetylmuramoyl-L-alanine amidase